MDTEIDAGCRITAEYQQAIAGVRDGIMRFLDRADNDDLWAAMTGNPLWAVYQQSIDDDIYERMDAEIWLIEGDCPFEHYELWCEGFYQVAARLCLDDEGVFHE